MLQLFGYAPSWQHWALPIGESSRNQLKKNILPEDFLNRVTNVFMYQMEKKCKYNLQWKYIKRLLKTLG